MKDLTWIDTVNREIVTLGLYSLNSLIGKLYKIIITFFKTVTAKVILELLKAAALYSFMKHSLII